MKIYNKSNFGWGLFLTVIGLAILAISIWTGFEVKGTILMAACLVLGATFLGRSLSHAMSREDKLAELDERNRLVKLRSKSAALTIAFGLMYLILFVTELIALAYFDRKL